MGSSNTQTQTSAPWSPAQPYIMQGLNDAGRLYSQGGFNVDAFDGPTVAPRNDMQAQAAQMVQGGTQASQDALAGALGTIQGFQSPDAAAGMTDALRQRVTEDIMPGINATFANSGMTGSSLHAQNLAKGMASGMAPVEAAMMETASDRAMRAAGMMPGMVGASYMPAEQLSRMGADLQNQEQRVLSADVLKHQQEQTAPIAAIQDYLTLTSSLGGQYSSSSGSAGHNPGLLGMMGFGMQALPLLGGF